MYNVRSLSISSYFTVCVYRSEYNHLSYMQECMELYTIKSEKYSINIHVYIENVETI